jgi:hypothetical protein
MRRAVVFTENEFDSVRRVVWAKLEKLERMRAKGADKEATKRISFLDSALRKMGGKP